MIVFTLAVTILAGCVVSDSITCWTYGSHPHCIITGSKFQANILPVGRSTTPNSDCASHFLVKVASLSGSRWQSFKCSMWMNVPEYHRDLYSFSHDALADGATAQTPFIYGYGRAASMKGKSDNSFDTFWYWPRAHSTDEHYSQVSYWFGNRKIIAMNSDKQTTRFASNKLFEPSTRWTYIGINRMYAQTNGIRGAGSGVCRLHCYTSESDGSGPLADVNPADEALTGNGYEEGHQGHDEYV